ncbi:MAG: hypothetical protein ACLP1E_01990 [Acidimicrobiales bacterium]
MAEGRVGGQEGWRGKQAAVEEDEDVVDEGGYGLTDAGNGVT